MVYQTLYVIQCCEIVLYVAEGPTHGISSVWKLSANIYKLGVEHQQKISQSVKTKAFMNYGKLESLHLMQPCYLEGVSLVSLIYKDDILWAQSSSKTFFDGHESRAFLRSVRTLRKVLET